MALKFKCPHINMEKPEVLRITDYPPEFSFSPSKYDSEFSAAKDEEQGDIKGNIESISATLLKVTPSGSNCPKGEGFIQNSLRGSDRGEARVAACFVHSLILLRQRSLLFLSFVPSFSDIYCFKLTRLTLRPGGYSWLYPCRHSMFKLRQPAQRPSSSLPSGHRYEQYTLRIRR